MCETVVRPTLQGMKDEGIPFNGVLYTGLMLTDNGPRVIEYNVRFGDPELQAMLPLLDEDVYALIHDATTGLVRSPKLKQVSTALVVLASKDYPESSEGGPEIIGLDQSHDSIEVFHAGTKLDQDGAVRASGGRVLNIVGKGVEREQALRVAYQQIKAGFGNFEGMQFRGDIGSNL